MTDWEKLKQDDDNNLRHTTLMMAIPIVIALMSLIYTILTNDGHSCYILDSGIYKYWLPNLVVDQTRVVTAFGSKQTCEYFTSTTTLGITLFVWALWKFVHEIFRTNSLNEIIVAKLSLVPGMAILIWLIFDFAKFGTIFKNNLVLSMYYNIAITSLFIFGFYLSLGFVLAGLAQWMRDSRAE